MVDQLKFKIHSNSDGKTTPKKEICTLRCCLLHRVYAARKNRHIIVFSLLEFKYNVRNIVYNTESREHIPSSEAEGSENIDSIQTNMPNESQLRDGT